MNKKQETLLGSSELFAYFPYTFTEAIRNHCTYPYKEDELKSLALMGKYWKFIQNTKFLKIENDVLIITQSPNENVITLCFFGYGVESIDVIKGNISKRINLERSVFCNYMVGNIEMKYDDPISVIKLNFHNNIEEALLINVQVIVFKEPEIDYRKAYLEKCMVRHRLGANLVNVFFQNAREDVDSVVIELFAVFENNEEMFIGKYKSDNNMRFVSIVGLGYGTYSYKVIQYSKDILIVETDKTPFTLIKPQYGR